jgi:hypothetical protein
MTRSRKTTKPFGAVLPLVFHSERFSVPPFVAACNGLQTTRSTLLLNELLTFAEEIPESLYAGPPLREFRFLLSASYKVVAIRSPECAYQLAGRHSRALPTRDAC